MEAGEMFRLGTFICMVVAGLRATLVYKTVQYGEEASEMQLEEYINWMGLYVTFLVLYAMSLSMSPVICGMGTLCSTQDILRSVHLTGLF